MIRPVFERKITPILKLKGLRAERGYSQQIVANLLGISTATYCRKENGIKDFSRYEIEALLKVFDIKYDDLFASCEFTAREARAGL